MKSKFNIQNLNLVAQQIEAGNINNFDDLQAVILDDQSKVFEYINGETELYLEVVDTDNDEPYALIDGEINEEVDVR